MQLPYLSLPSTTVVIVWPFFVIFVVFVRSAERERCVRTLDGDAERCDERDDGRGNEFRPSFTLNLTLNILSVLFFLFVFRFVAFFFFRFTYLIHKFRFLAYTNYLIKFPFNSLAMGEKLFFSFRPVDMPQMKSAS